MKGKKIFKHLKKNIVLYLLLLVSIITGVLVKQSFNSMQSYDATPLKLEFAGQYSYDGGNWLEFSKDTKIKASETVYLKGSFNHDLPDYFIVNIYLNHLDAEVIYNDRMLLKTTGLAADGVYKKFTCGKYWTALRLPNLQQGEEVTIKLYNSHGFGNGPAVDEFLDNIYVGSPDTIKDYLEPTYQVNHFIGYVILIFAVLLIGAFLSSLILKFKFDINILLLSLILIGTGLLSLFDIQYVINAFEINRFNTAILVISLILTTLFIGIYNVNNIKNKLCSNISKILVVVESVFVLTLMCLTVFNVLLIYDILLYWIIGINVINLCLIAINVWDIIKTKRLVLMKVLLSVIFVALMIDSMLIGIGKYSDYKILKLSLFVFILYNLFLVVRMIVLAFKSTIENKKLQNIVNFNEISIKISQIQPHFLYNSLNSIYYLCEKDPKKAQTAIKNFSEYLHGNLEFLSKREFIKIKDELSFVNKYLELEIMRYGDDKIKVVQEIENQEFEIPALIIQPLVENSIKHGLSKKTNGGNIFIKTVETDSDYTIMIEDDGVGFDMKNYNKDGKVHIGLNNVKARIESLCDGEFVVESNKNEGTKIKIVIPK
jgi:sensor histidine kinase YesM